MAATPNELFSTLADPTRRAIFERRHSSGLDPLDLLRALAGVANTGSGPDGERAAKRMVDILIAGVRMRSEPSWSNANPRCAQRAIPPSIVRLEPVI